MANTTIANETKLTMPAFGGRYQQLSEATYKGLVQLFGVSPKVAEKIARDIAGDFGNAMKTGNVTGFKIGAANKDNRATLSDTTKVKSFALTNSLSIGRAIQWAGEAGKNGVSYQGTGWEFSPVLAQYIANLETEMNKPESNPVQSV